VSNKTEITEPPIELKELKPLLDAVDKRKPDPQAVARLRAHLAAMPDLCLALGDTNFRLENRLIERLFPHKAAQIAARQRAAAVRDGLGYQGATQLEQLLIDHAVLCWLRLQDVERGYSSAMERSMSLGEADFWDRHLAAARRRYLRACETLARVRRLLHPTLQVNIAAQGGQQVNVSGDLRLPPSQTSAAPAPSPHGGDRCSVPPEGGQGWGVGQGSSSFLSPPGKGVG